MTRCLAHTGQFSEALFGTIPLRAIDTAVLFPFDASLVKVSLALPSASLALLCLALVGCAAEPPKALHQPKAYQIQNPGSFPIALDKDFEFRKTKEYFLDPVTPKYDSKNDPSVAFERYYRTYGAITALDARDLFGTYFDFFWRGRRDADVKVRLEYRQEKLHAFVQAREVHYPKAKGHNRTEFAIIGDEFAAAGRVIAWRVLLIEDGRVVALTRSYLWE